MEIDRSGWSGDGDFTVRLLAALEHVDEIAAVRVEDAPASRSDAGYVLLANDVFLRFATERRARRAKWFGLVPVSRFVETPALTLELLESRLAVIDGIGPADYADEGMIQYLRTARIAAPHQTRGYKLVELVRIYGSRASVKAASRSGRQRL